MSKTNVVVALVLGLVPLAAFAGPHDPVAYPEVPGKVFVPPGFDGNDRAQIVLTGDLPDTCHRVGEVTARVDAAAGRIVVRHELLQYDSCWCLYVDVPYTQVVELGVVPAGEYKILFERETGPAVKLAEIRVAPTTTTSPDDELYAQVEDVSIDTVGGKVLARLKGTLPGACATLREVRVLARAPSVIEVLPIAEAGAAGCATAGMASFDTRVELPVAQAQGTGAQILVHVRSLNGQAVNRIHRLGSEQGPGPAGRR